jgi:hypothetical protein
MSGIGYTQTNPATLLSVGFTPECGIRSAGESRHVTTASPTKAGGFDEAAGRRLMTRVGHCKDHQLQISSSARSRNTPHDSVSRIDVHSKGDAIWVWSVWI